jgi:hypothetical protein
LGEALVNLDLASRIAANARANQRLVHWGRILALVFVVVGSLDVVSTNAALAAGHLEGNPLVGSLQASLGPWWALPKVAFHLALAYLILWIPSRRTLRTAVFVNLGYGALVANNFYIAGWVN